MQVLLSGDLWHIKTEKSMKTQEATEKVESMQKTLIKYLINKDLNPGISKQVYAKSRSDLEYSNPILLTIHGKTDPVL